MKNYKSLFGPLVNGQWPNITAKNASVQGAVDGTPFTEDFINDIWGFMQAVMLSANLTPDGQSESSGASQILQAQKIITQNIIFPIGKRYTQYPNDYSPNELKAKGVFPANSHWEIWNHRAEMYGLVPQALPSFSVYTPGLSYPANAYVMYHLDGDDYALFKAKAAVTNAAQQIEPVLWDKLQPDVFVPRRFLQEWIDGDFLIGDQIEGGEYDGMYVAEINVCGGKFPSYAGGNRPPFVDGGTADDMMRPITGKVNVAGGIGIYMLTTSGCFYRIPYNAHFPSMAPGDDGMFGFDNSRVVNVGHEFSPRTLSVLYWRCVA
jgi:hypothetical protein